MWIFGKARTCIPYLSQGTKLSEQSDLLQIGLIMHRSSVEAFAASKMADVLTAVRGVPRFLSHR